jgi:hypothetical protein
MIDLPTKNAILDMNREAAEIVAFEEAGSVESARIHHELANAYAMRVEEASNS